jgi:Mg2+/citrate symporter
MVPGMKVSDVGLSDLQVLGVAAGTGSPVLYVLAIIVFGVVRASRLWAPVVPDVVRYREKTKQVTAQENQAVADRRSVRHRAAPDRSRRTAGPT